MSHLPVLSGQEMVKILEKVGFKLLRQKGSHVIMIKTINGKNFKPVIPLHSELKNGTLLSILKQANVSRSELQELIK